MSLRSLYFCLAAISFAANIFAQPKVDLTEGTLFINGSLTFRYELVILDKPQHELGLVSDVGGGYFISDGIAVGISLPGEWNFASGLGDVKLDQRGSLGLKLSATYFFNIDNSIVPYVGGSLTPAYSMGDKTFKLKAGIDGGILVSLSQSVALDFGMRPEIHFKLFDTQKWRFSLPAGFIGVRAFF